MKFEDQEPNFLESLAQAVPSPHHAASRAAKVALTSRTSAARRLVRLTNRCRTRRRTVSLSPCFLTMSPARGTQLQSGVEAGQRLPQPLLEGPDEFSGSCGWRIAS